MNVGLNGRRAQIEDVWGQAKEKTCRPESKHYKIYCGSQEADRDGQGGRRKEAKIFVALCQKGGFVNFGICGPEIDIVVKEIIDIDDITH